MGMNMRAANRTLLVKLATIAAIAIATLAPMHMAGELIAERRALRDKVLQEVAQSGTGAQRLEGIALILPCTETYEETETLDRERTAVRRHTRACDVHVLPERLRIGGDIGTELRHRGIYPALVYRTRLALTGSFSIPAQEASAETKRSWGTPRLVIGIADVRGIRNTPVLDWNATPIPFEAGVGNAPWSRGIQAAVPVDPLRGGVASIALTLDLAGMERLEFVPAAGDMSVRLRSAWPHPSFTGRFLPESRTVSETGFEAAWHTTDLATNVYQTFQRCGRGKCDEYLAAVFGVSLLQGVDVYQRSYRALHYGILLVLLTFALFFLYELLAGLRVHPIQYGLVGIALAVFFVLLIALAEHVRFELAYLIAAGACIGLIGTYVRAVLGSIRRAAGLCGLLTGLYAALYMVLGSEDYALLMGALLMFSALAVFMLATRRLDWYRVTMGGAAPAEANPSGG
jgi:inner membrane protein